MLLWTWALVTTMPTYVNTCKQQGQLTQILSLSWRIAICSGGCGTNQNCTAPETCTCVEGWTGQDCLTGICCVSIEIMEATTILMGDYACYDYFTLNFGLNILNVCYILYNIDQQYLLYNYIAICSTGCHPVGGFCTQPDECR